MSVHIIILFYHGTRLSHHWTLWLVIMFIGKANYTDFKLRPYFTIQNMVEIVPRILSIIMAEIFGST